MIKGVFYSEFDNDAGPQIVFQAPPTCVVFSFSLSRHPPFLH